MFKIQALKVTIIVAVELVREDTPIKEGRLYYRPGRQFHGSKNGARTIPTQNVSIKVNGRLRFYADILVMLMALIYTASKVRNHPNNFSVTAFMYNFLQNNKFVKDCEPSIALVCQNAI